MITKIIKTNIWRIYKFVPTVKKNAPKTPPTVAIATHPRNVRICKMKTIRSERPEDYNQRSCAQRHDKDLQDK